MPNSLSTHVSSVVSAVLAVLTALDKSLTVTSLERSVIVVALVLGALVLQLAHVGLKAKALSIYGNVDAAVKAAVSKLPASVQADVGSLSKEIIADVKNEVEGASAPTLAQTPTTPIA